MDRTEFGSALAAVDQGEAILAHIKAALENSSSRMIVFNFRGHFVIKLADLDLWEEKLSIKKALAF